MCAPYFQDIGFACELSGSQKETSNHCRRNMHRFLLIGLFLTLLYQQSGAYVHPHEQKNAGSSAAAKIRKNDKGLTHLFIPRTKIGDAGAKSIAEALQENKYLNHLDLGGNNITDEGAVALAKALEMVALPANTYQALMLLSCRGCLPSNLKYFVYLSALSTMRDRRLLCSSAILAPR